MVVAKEALFLIALAITIISEALILIIVIRWLFRLNAAAMPVWKILLAGFFASFATLPYVWFVLPFWLKDYLALTIVGELSVWAVESLFYFFALKIGLKRAMLASFICNAVSYGIGLVIF
jgi:hypothetical protein